MNDHRHHLLSSGEHVELAVLSNGVAVVTFNSAGSRVNLLSSTVMNELSRVIEHLETGTYVYTVSGGTKAGGVVFDKDLPTVRRFKAAIFRSAKPGCFIAGADIKEIQKLRDIGSGVREILMLRGADGSPAFEGCQKGKELLSRIAALPFTTVAAINGRCLGGGAELALACDEQLVAGNKQTVLGLPEVGLGVLPGWGGTVRLPRKIGFLAAAGVILNPLAAKSAQAAWRCGMVSEVVPEQRLLARAVEVALGAPVRRHRPEPAQRALRSVFDSKPGRFFVSAAMRLVVRLKTGGKLPAFGKALEVMNAAIELPPEKAFKLESRTFAWLVLTDACGKCVQKFLDYQAAKKAKAAAA